MESITDEELREWLPLKGPFATPGELASLEALVIKASERLLFEATPGDEGGSITMTYPIEKNDEVLEVLECLRYYPSSGSPTSRSNEKVSYKCKSINQVRKTLGDAVNKDYLLRHKDDNRKDDIELCPYAVASAIVMVLTSRGKIRVCGKYIRWAKPEFRRKDAFECNDFMHINLETDVDVSSSIEHLKSSKKRVPRLSIKIDSNTRLNLFRPLLQPTPFRPLVELSPFSSNSICGGRVNVHYLSDNNIDELKSEWDISYSSGQGSAIYRTLEDDYEIYLH